MTVGEESRTVTAGDCVFIPPDAPHDLLNGDTGPLTVLWVYAPLTVVEHWAEERAAGGGRS